MNDSRIVREALDRYERPLLAYARRIVGGDLERARDVVQETFARLCNQPPADVNGHADLNGHLAEWLYTVCRNHALDVRRKERRHMPMLEGTAEAIESDAMPPDRAAENQDSTSHILRLLSRLPDNQQEVIRLKFQHQMSYRQISAITGNSESNVGFLIHAGIKAIRMQVGTADERR
jgi:RNA polymerase sigma factor (sigma-70 family)